MPANLLNLDQAPDDALERLLWLSGVAEETKRELDAELQRVYYNLRLQRRLAPALALGLHPKKKVLAWTRRENWNNGTSVRWNDGLS